MLVIRLARQGRTKYPVYRIVAAESARAATGKFVEILGHYNPHTKDLVVKKEAVEERLQKGAQPSNTVIKLLQREKIDLPEWVQLKTKQRAPKKAAEAKPAPAAKAEEPKPAEKETVAEAATENAAAVKQNEQPTGKTETTEDTEASAEAAAKGQEAAADSAITPPKEPKKDSA